MGILIQRMLRDKVFGLKSRGRLSGVFRAIASTLASLCVLMASTIMPVAASSANSYNVAPANTGSEGEPLLPDGLRLLPYTMQGGYKVFHLTARPVWWNNGRGLVVEAWAYNGTAPGPEIQVDVGDKVKVIVQNDLPE